MSIEKFEVHGGSQDGRMFEFVNPFRPLTFSMDGHERYCLRPDNASFGLVAPDADLVIHKDEKDIQFGTLEVPDDGKIEATEAFSAGSKCISTEDYIADLRADAAEGRRLILVAWAANGHDAKLIASMDLQSWIDKGAVK